MVGQFMQSYANPANVPTEAIQAMASMSEQVGRLFLLYYYCLY